MESPNDNRRIRSARKETKPSRSSNEEAPTETSSSRRQGQAPFRRTNTDEGAAGNPARKARSGRKGTRTKTHDSMSKSAPNHHLGSSDRRARRDPVSTKDLEGKFSKSTSDLTKTERRLLAAKSMAPRTEEEFPLELEDDSFSSRSRSESPTPPKKSSSKREGTQERRPRGARGGGGGGAAAEPRTNSSSPGKPRTNSSSPSSNNRYRVSRQRSAPGPGGTTATPSGRPIGRKKERSNRSKGATSEEMNRSWSRNGAADPRRQRGPARRTETDPTSRRTRNRDAHKNLDKIREPKEASTFSGLDDVSIDEVNMSEAEGGEGSSSNNFLDDHLLGDDNHSSEGEEDLLSHAVSFASSKQRSTVTSASRKKASKKRTDGQGILMKQLERSLKLQDAMLEGLEDGTDAEETEDEREKSRNNRNHHHQRGDSPVRTTTTTDASGKVVRSYIPKLAPPKLNMNLNMNMNIPAVTTPKIMADTAAAAVQTAAMASESAAATATYFASGATATATSAANALNSAATRAAASAQYFVPTTKGKQRDGIGMIGPSPRDTSKAADFRTSTLGGNKIIQGPQIMQDDFDF